nr:hypothetical protein [Tanacetum cinerariifolium]
MSSSNHPIIVPSDFDIEDAFSFTNSFNYLLEISPKDVKTPFESSILVSPSSSVDLHHRLEGVASVLEAQAAIMANADNPNRNPRPRETLVAKRGNYKQFISYQLLLLYVKNKGVTTSGKESSTSGNKSSWLGNECSERSNYGNDTDIRPSYDTKTMAEVPNIADYNVFAVEKQHTKKPEFNNDTYDVGQCLSTAPTASASRSASVSFATLFKGHSSHTRLNFCTLITPARNGADVVVPLESIRLISKRFANLAYGFFLEKQVAYPVVATYDPNVKLLKEDVGNVLVWIKLYGVPVMVLSEDGLSAIATKLENDDDLGTNKEISKSAEKGSLHVAHVSSSNTPIIDKMDKLEHQILDGKLMFVDDDGNLLVPTGNVDNESEVEVVFDETTNLMVSTSSKGGNDRGYGNNSL